MSTAVLPTLPGLDWNITRTPQWSTSVQTATSGRENRTANWSYPTYKWTLAYQFLRADANAEFQELIGFYNARQGQWDSFLFTDPYDNAVTNQEIGVGDGSTTAFQLVKTFGGYVEPVPAPNTVTAVTAGGAVVSGYTVDPSIGTLTFSSAPAATAPIVASFSYYYRVRFGADSYDFNNFLYNLFELHKIELVSLK